MAQGIKMPAANAGNLSLIPGIHILKEEKQFQLVVLPCSHVEYASPQVQNK